MAKRIASAAVVAALSSRPRPGRRNPRRPAVETALFAGGCFWSLESSFEKAYGVIAAVSGYAGGKKANPTYENYEENGYVEAVQVTFDTSRISYAELLDVYWHHTDPTDPDGAFVDRGRAIPAHRVLRERCAADGGGGLQSGSRKIEGLRKADSRGHRPGAQVLAGRGISPAVRAQESRPATRTTAPTRDVTNFSPRFGESRPSSMPGAAPSAVKGRYSKPVQGGA